MSFPWGKKKGLRECKKKKITGGGERLLQRERLDEEGKCP